MEVGYDPATTSALAGARVSRVPFIFPLLSLRILCMQ